MRTNTKSKITIFGSGSLAARLIGQITQNSNQCFRVNKVISTGKPWELQRMECLKRLGDFRYKLVTLRRENLGMTRGVLDDTDIAIICNDDFDSEVKSLLWKEYANFNGVVVICTPLAVGSFIAPPYLEPKPNMKCEIFPLAKAVYYHGNCLQSGLSPFLGLLRNNLAQVEVRALMLPRSLPSYPTATKLFGSHFPAQTYVDLQKDLLSKIAGVAVDLQIKESTGLAFYEIDLNLRLKKDVDLAKQINDPEIAWCDDMSWQSMNDLYEYIVEPAFQIGNFPPQIIVYRYLKRGLNISISLAIHHPTVTPWSILRALKMVM